MRKSDRIALALAMAAGVIAAQDNTVDQGFTDTPMLPGLPWHVHDPARPHPKIVTPSAQPGQPPSDAVVLFDGRDLAHWTTARLGTASFTVSADPAPWKVMNGYFEVAPRSGDIATKEKFADVQLHVEWQEPPDIAGSSQNRGNSGVFLMGLFEIQVLDSYRSRTYADGQAGAMYGQYPPLVNAVGKPGQWQAYDIAFEAPRYAGDRLQRPASMTVFLNGVLLHNHKEEMGPTIYRQVPRYAAGPSEGPLILQDHGSRVRYRNIWARRIGEYDQPE
jgi:Domain of Unknown Function (DUF1080)